MGEGSVRKITCALVTQRRLARRATAAMQDAARLDTAPRAGLVDTSAQSGTCGRRGTQGSSLRRSSRRVSCTSWSCPRAAARWTSCDRRQQMPQIQRHSKRLAYTQVSRLIGLVACKQPDQRWQRRCDSFRFENVVWLLTQFSECAQQGIRQTPERVRLLFLIPKDFQTCAPFLCMPLKAS